MKLLLAVDGSTGSEAAAKEVARRPWPPDSELKIVSAADPVLRPTHPRPFGGARQIAVLLSAN